VYRIQIALEENCKWSYAKFVFCTLRIYLLIYKFYDKWIVDDWLCWWLNWKQTQAIVLSCPVLFYLNSLLLFLSLKKLMWTYKLYMLLFHYLNLINMDVSYLLYCMVALISISELLALGYRTVMFCIPSIHWTHIFNRFDVFLQVWCVLTGLMCSNRFDIFLQVGCVLTGLMCSYRFDVFLQVLQLI